MKKLIAFCGLDCGACEARLATMGDDDGLRKKVAKLWSDLNSVEITPEMINCMGCRTDGVKTPYCESLYPIRQCAMSRKHETCGVCTELETCDRVRMVTGNNADALRNLKAQASLLRRSDRDMPRLQ